MFKGLKNLIAKIQNSPEAARKRWLIILSGLSMAAVLGLWVLYINLVVGTAESKLTIQSQEEEKSPGAGATFLAGLKIVGSQIKESGSGLVSRLREKLGETNSIEIRGEERNFILEGLEEIPKTSLP